MRKLTIHADDFGLSREISESITACAATGSIHSVSIMVTTGIQPEDVIAIRQVKNSPELKLHLDLVEGRPLALDQTSPLVDIYTGKFKYGFVGLLRKNYLSSTQTRKKIMNDIRTEARAQIARFIELTGQDQVAIDSHCHVHMIPFVLHAIFSLREEMEISSIRLSREKMRFSWKFLSRFFSTNMAKVFILNLLACINRKSLASIRGNEYIIGILDSGNVTISAIERGTSTNGKDDRIEVILHPGLLSESGANNWAGNDQSLRFYQSENRRKEYELLNSGELNDLLEKTNHNI